MKAQLKLILPFVVIAVAFGGLCLSPALRAQSSAASPYDPNANKKEAPAAAVSSPTPTPAPRG